MGEGTPARWAWKVRLRVGISTAFLLVIVPLFGATVGYLYRSATGLSLDIAAQSMDRSTQDVAEEVQTLLDSAERVVETAAVLAQSDRDGARRDDDLRLLYEQIRNNPHIYSAFITYDDGDNLFEVMQLPAHASAFGPAGRPPPDRARFALRTVAARSGERVDAFTYLADWGNPVGRESQKTDYDPQTRPWYKAALHASRVALSDPYVFASSGQPGVTLSLRVVDGSGAMIGAAGVDVSLDGLSRFLERKRIGFDGRLFVLDAAGRLLGASGAGRQASANAVLELAQDAPDPVIAGAVRLRAGGSGDKFAGRLGPRRTDYLVAFAPFPSGFAKNWTIGVAVDRDEIVGPVRLISFKILLIGALAASLAALAILVLSRMMTEPLRQVVGETERIRDFNLEAGANIHSRIVEINDLAVALEAMRNSVKSFGAYVPRELVRRILASGASTAIGGERRFVSVMFSDIEGFTGKAEGMPPERVLATLSAYFQALSQAIQEHGGVIDKFIGDSVMALWNVPIGDPEHVNHACLAMLACRSAAEALNARLADDAMLPFHTRFGLHAGDMVVGNVGATERMQYTALGAAVNLASRVEGLNKVYGTQLLVTGAVEERACREFAFRPVDNVVPAGLSRPIAIFELLGTLGKDSAYPLADDTRRMQEGWSRCYALYLHRDWDAAASAFKAFAEAFPEDALIRLYLDRCSIYRSRPPSPDWDGALHLDHK